ncbi:substrate-binding domain-containing protein kinase family protein [Leptothoe spongobia]|uniref:Protein kinase domain-containing protein n=1 Tax=Leptothoe spongobia TAU-MAC 1115 TaxID=1967444 RepID=A0A947DHB1_9CYAN|nr:hypothetical protein [Leptothoe spongobia]MBT9316638.1 hypothetical protein [Leptothoe spongobia TAU-MAC 1115]
MRPSITNGSEDLQSSHCKLLGNLWGRFDLYFDHPIGKNLYLGRQEASQEEVWVKEYLLNDMADVQRHAFQQLIDLNLRLGQGPDFRLVQLKDFATTQQACYLISHPLKGAEPLSQYLSAHGPLSPCQVRQALQQCLETLRYLHTACSVLWPTGSERGLCHGNLSLDSLWIRTIEDSPRSDNFFIYVTDLALWEHIFGANQSLAQCVQDLGSIHQDLHDLGHLGFSLLLGQGLNTTENTAQLLSEMELQSPELMTFLYGLTGQTAATFRTTEEALQDLRDLPELSHQPMTGLSLAPPVEVVADTPSIQATIKPIAGRAYLKQSKTAVGAAMGLLGILWLGYSVIQQWQLRPLSAHTITASYLLEPQGTWQSILATSSENSHFIDALLDEGHSLKPVKSSGIRPDQMTRGDIFEQLLEEQADFALMDNDDDIPAGLQVQPIAYDAVVPFVAFSNGNQAKRATTFMGDSLSLSQLRQVFTGKTDTINGSLVQAYFPEVPYIKAYPLQTSDTAERPPKVRFSAQPPLFERFSQQVLGGEPESVEAMERLLEKSRGDLRSQIQQNNGHGNYDVFSNVNRTFHQWNVLDNTSEPTIGIGFDRLSKVQQQCDVYPLAIDVEGRQLQLLQQDSEPISPRTDLCRDRIQPDTALVQQLATEGLLAYELVVVYPETSKTGAAVAELLRHPDNQNRLQAAGIIPIDRSDP